MRCAEACGSGVQSTGGSRQALSQQTFAHHAGVASSSSINHAASAVNNDASFQSYLNNLNTSRPAGPGPSSQHPTSLGPSNALPNFGGYGSGLATHGPAPGGNASMASDQIQQHNDNNIQLQMQLQLLFMNFTNLNLNFLRWCRVSESN